MAKRRSKSNWRALAADVTHLESRRLLAITATWVGQSVNQDFVGPEAGAGPDGIYDDVIHVRGINTTLTLDDFDIVDGSFVNPVTRQAEGRWETQQANGTGGNLGGYAPARMVITPGSSGAEADIYLNPNIYIKNTSNNTYTDHVIVINEQLTVTATYFGSTPPFPSEFSSTTVSTSPNGEQPASSTVPATATQYTLNQVGFVNWTQNANNVPYPGWVNLALSGVNYSKISGAVLTDPAGVSWGAGSSSGVNIDSTNPILLPSQASPSTISFPPLRNEQNSNMSLTIYYNDGTLPGVSEFKGGFSDPGRTAPTGNNTVYSLTPSGDTSGVGDLNNLTAALNTQDGIIQLGPSANSQSGQYFLDGPISIARPVTLEGAPGATITVTFLSGSSPSAWSDAIEIDSDQIKLKNFNVNFNSTIPWNTAGLPPAVIGDVLFAESGSNQYLVHGSRSVYFGTSYRKNVLNNISIERLGITGPAAPATSQRNSPTYAEEQSALAPEFYQTGINSADGTATGNVLDQSLDLFSLYDVVDGRIDNNTLSGGSVVFNGGPWNIDDNDIQGAVPGMVTISAIDDYRGSTDTTIRGNHVHQVNIGGDIGRLYEFFTVTGTDSSYSYDDTIVDNQVDGGLGLLPQDLSTYFDSNQNIYRNGSAHDNHPEVTLFESYASTFVGKPLFVSDGSSSDPFGGRLIVIPSPPSNGAVQIGSVLSILSGRDNGHTSDPGASGDQAGQWGIVEQVLFVAPTYTVLLIDRPLPHDPQPQYGYVVSVAQGHVNLDIENNTIKLAGTFSIGVVLTGNDFNARIIGNRFVGGDEMEDYNNSIAEGMAFDVRSSATNPPGPITYAPSLGTIIDDNVIQGSLGGGSLELLHGYGSISSADRTYLTASVTRNVWEWNDNFINAPMSTPFVDAVPPSSQYLPAKAAAQSYPYPSVFNTDPADHGSIGTHPNGNASQKYYYPLLKTLTIGDFNSHVNNNNNVTTATQNWALDPSWTVGQTANTAGYYEDGNSDSDGNPNGAFVDPIEEVVNVQGNSYQILDHSSGLPISQYSFPTNYEPPKTVIVAGIVNATPNGPSTPAFDTTLVPAASSPTVSISAGGTAVDAFVADSSYYGAGNVTQPNTSSTTAAIDTSGVTNPDPQSVYQNERNTGDVLNPAPGLYFTETITGLVAGSSYSVRLDFAEFSYSAAQQREFNVSINNVQVLTNFDIFATAGMANKAVAETFAVAADNSGQIQIKFTNVYGGAKIDGIEVTPAASFKAIMVGQDGSDLVGSQRNVQGTSILPSPPDGITDEHLALTGLLGKVISEILVRPYGGGGGTAYEINPASDDNQHSNRGILLRSPGSSTADFYFEANRTDIGLNIPGSSQQNHYDITVTYADNTADGSSVYGVFNDPSLKFVPAPQPLAIPFDYDGDHRADYALFRPSVQVGVNANVFIYQSSASNAQVSHTIGSPGDIPVAADFFGDGLTDYAVFRPVGGAGGAYFAAFDPGTGQVILTNPAAPPSATNLPISAFQPGDIPVPADYLGEGKAQFAAYRPGNWSFIVYDPLANSVITIQMPGGQSGDIPVPADYDGDGKVDFAVYRPADQSYHVVDSGAVPSYSSPGSPGAYVFTSTSFQPGDLPVPADYDGIGRAEFAVYRPGYSTASGSSASEFLISNLLTGNISTITSSSWGTFYPTPGDYPVVADYDGDGKADYAFYHGTTVYYLSSATKQEVTSNPIDNNFNDYELAGIFNPVNDYGDRRLGYQKVLYGDFTGDTQVDYATYNEGGGTSAPTGTLTYGQAGSSASPTTVMASYSLPGDIPVPAYYVINSAHTATLAVYRPSNATFYVNGGSSAGIKPTGALAGDMPVPGDYFNRGYAQFAVYRPGNYTYYVLDNLTNATYAFQIVGGQAGDIPVPGDYLHQGFLYPAVYRPGNQNFYVVVVGYSSGIGYYVANNNSGAPYHVPNALPGDIPVPAHYLPDNQTDLAVYRESATYSAYATSQFIIYNGAIGQDTIVAWGAPGDIPVPDNYLGGTGGQGDGVYSSGTPTGYGYADVAVFRQNITPDGTGVVNFSTNEYFILDPQHLDSSGYVARKIGVAGDMATAANLDFSYAYSLASNAGTATTTSPNAATATSTTDASPSLSPIDAGATDAAPADSGSATAAAPASGGADSSSSAAGSTDTTDAGTLAPTTTDPAATSDGGVSSDPTTPFAAPATPMIVTGAATPLPPSPTAFVSPMAVNSRSLAAAIPTSHAFDPRIASARPTQRRIATDADWSVSPSDSLRE